MSISKALIIIVLINKHGGHETWGIYPSKLRVRVLVFLFELYALDMRDILSGKSESDYSVLDTSNANLLDRCNTWEYIYFLIRAYLYFIFMF